MRIFELGPGRKFRGTVDSGRLRLEIRMPDTWHPVVAADLVSVATNALALAAVGEAPAGFRFTQDDRYVDTNPLPPSPFGRR